MEDSSASFSAVVLKAVEKVVVQVRKSPQAICCANHCCRYSSSRSDICPLWIFHHVRCHCWRHPPPMKLRPVAMCLPSCHHLLRHRGTPHCVVLKNTKPAVMYVETGNVVLRVLTERKPLWGGDNQRQGLRRCSTLSRVLSECKHGSVCMLVLISGTRSRQP